MITGNSCDNKNFHFVRTYDIEVGHLCYLKDIWDQLDSEDLYYDSIFTIKAQKHILKELGIETQDLKASKAKQQLLNITADNKVSNLYNVCLNENYDTKQIEICVGTFNGEIVNDRYFKGKYDYVTFEFKPNDIGLVELLPNCALDGVLEVFIVE